MLWWQNRRDKGTTVSFECYCGNNVEDDKHTKERLGNVVLIQYGIVKSSSKPMVVGMNIVLGGVAYNNSWHDSIKAPFKLLYGKNVEAQLFPRRRENMKEARFATKSYADKIDVTIVFKLEIVQAQSTFQRSRLKILEELERVSYTSALPPQLSADVTMSFHNLKPFRIGKGEPLEKQSYSFSEGFFWKITQSVRLPGRPKSLCELVILISLSSSVSDQEGVIMKFPVVFSLIIALLRKKIPLKMNFDITLLWNPSFETIALFVSSAMKVTWSVIDATFGHYSWCLQLGGHLMEIQ
ncbi:hypothetical protein Tco_0830268 [Tanacetum coccineum]